MFASKKQNTTIIAEGLKIVGSVATDGLVEVYGQVDGEMRCASVVISRQAHVAGTMVAENEIDLETRLKEVFIRSGFQGSFTVVTDYEVQPGDCRLEWDGGGAERQHGRPQPQHVLAAAGATAGRRADRAPPLL